MEFRLRSVTHIAVSSGITEEGEQAFTECLVGVMRTKAIRDHVSGLLCSGACLDDVISRKPKSQCVGWLHNVCPEGMFHLFSNEESISLKLLEPIEEELDAEEKLFWMECLIGSQRSNFVDEALKFSETITRYKPR